MRAAVPWSLRKIRITWWDGEPPETGDEFNTRRGRRYLIIKIVGKTHHCVLLPPEEPRQGRQLMLIWGPRRSNPVDSAQSVA